MTKMKKLFAVVLALAMLVTMSSFSAFAEEATVTMTATGDVEAKEITVVINASENVGGLTAELSYEKDKVTYVGISGAEAANSEADTVKDDKNGTLDIVLLGSDLTVKFEALAAAGTFTFDLTNVVASNATGTATLEVPAVASQTVEFHSVITEGNTVRKTTEPENQDLGFVSTFIGKALPEDAKNVKLGFVALPKNMLVEGKELTVANYEKALPVEVEVTRAAIAAEESTDYIAYISGMVDTPSRMGRIISGRFYVSYTIGDSSDVQYVYSNNDSESPAVTDGVVSKSFVGTCKAMASVILNNNTDDDIKYDTSEGSITNDRTAVEAIVRADKTEETQRLAILDFVVANADLLEQISVH